MRASSITPSTTRRPRAQRSLERGSTRETLVRCGVAICSERGFQVTGIEEILRLADVPKGSFYHYFPSKRDFGLAVIDSYADYFARKLQRILDDQNMSPLRRLHEFVEQAQLGMERYEFRRGCLIGNLGQELASLNDEFRQRLENVLLRWQQQTAACLQQAQSAGEISTDANTNELAEFFWIGWEGAILRAKLTRNKEPMSLFARYFFERIAL